MRQLTTIFSLFMVFFYFGMGCFFVFFFKNSTLDRALLVICGSTFILYGIFRAIKTYNEIIEVFFRKDDNDE